MELKFIRYKTFDIEIHRSGWNWVVQHLYKKFHNDKAEVLFDDFLERTFDWDYFKNSNRNLPHYNKPWIGFLHNPLTVTKPFDIKASCLNLCSRLPFLRAIANCKGIYTLSEDLADSIRYIFDVFHIKNVPINILKHPTVLDVSKFNLNDFYKDPKVTNIGYWLRDFTPFFMLDTPCPKHVLLGKLQYARDNFEIQKNEFKLKQSITGEKAKYPVKVHQALTNKDYDDFLTSSIAYLNLIDTSANNAVIECIARNIPLLVNYHPAIVEYLGKEYPFYYITSEGANKKINDKKCIEDTYNYLKNMDKGFLDIKTFIHDFEYSDILNNIN